MRYVETNKLVITYTIVYILEMIEISIY